jgi:hypothetical protein
VTDADLVLGYLSAEGFLGGDMMLDAERALDAIARHVGEPAGLDPVEAAWSIFETVTEAMAQATMIHALEQGKRISDYAMIAIGGAGPVHAVAIAQRLGLRKVICPAGAGVASAYGFLAAPVSFEFVRSAIGPVSPQSIAEALGLVAELEREGRLLLEEAGVRGDAIVPEVRCCARYAWSFRSRGACSSVRTASRCRPILSPPTRPVTAGPSRAVILRSSPGWSRSEVRTPSSGFLKWRLARSALTTGSAWSIVASPGPIDRIKSAIVGRSPVTPGLPGPC